MDSKNRHIRKTLIFTRIIIIAIIFIANPILSEQGFSRVLEQQNILTSYQRTQSVKRNCRGIVRQQLFNRQQSEAHSTLMSYFRQTFAYDHVGITRQFLLGNYAEAGLLLQRNMTPIVLFILPFLLCLTLLALLWPFLLCFCLCPRSNTPKCLQKYEKYSKSQLRSPVTCIVLMTLLCLGGAIYGFISSASFDRVYSQARCNTAVIFDDMLNGNVSTINSKNSQGNLQYFMGISTFSNQLSLLSQNIDSLQNSYARIRSNSTIINKINSQITQADSQITQIPSTNGEKAVITYKSPIVNSAPLSTIISTFPDILGKSTENNTLVGSAIKNLAGVRTIISPVIKSADNLTDNLLIAKSELPLAQTHSEQAIGRYMSLDTYYNDLFDTYATVPQSITIGFYVLGTAIILFSIMTLMGACFVCFVNLKFKPIMYCGCVSLLIVGILIMVLSLFFAAFVPAGTIGCGFANNTLANKVNFQHNTEGFIENQQTAIQVMQCLSSSQGDVLGQFGGIQIYTVYQQMMSLQISIAAYQNSDQVDLVQASYLEIGNRLNAVIQTNFVDIDDSQSLVILKKLSKANNYACSDIDFSKDSWVPSNNQNPIVVPCNFSGGNQCSSQNSFNSGCQGCLDSSLIFQGSATTDVTASLATRYSAVNCNSFITEFSNVWENYYLSKQTQFSPIKSRFASAQTNVYKVINTGRNEMNALFDDILIKRTPIIAAVNPENGFMAGTNCRVFGQDLDFLYKRTCNQMVPSVFFLVIAIGIIGYAILFISCSVVLISIRYSHQDQMTNQVTRKYTTAKTAQSAHNMQDSLPPI